jgi:hypothetical protein
VVGYMGIVMNWVYFYSEDSNNSYPYPTSILKNYWPVTELIFSRKSEYVKILQAFQIVVLGATILGILFSYRLEVWILPYI